jgi:hypothetical protein
MKPLMALLADVPHDPSIKPRAWRLLCGASCGCREELGRVLAGDVAAHQWLIALDDHYQPGAEGVFGGVFRWVPRIRRAKMQPWATGTGSPAPAVVDGTRQHVAVQDMRQRDAGGRPLRAGQQIGPIGILTPADVVIICRHGHYDHVTVEQIESEVLRLAEPLVFAD